MNNRERIKTGATFLVLIGCDIFLGLRGTWWLLVIPAFFIGWLVDVCATRLAILAATLVWLVAALSYDIPTGFRLSARIAGVLSAPTFLSAYVVTLLIALILAGLSAHAGRCLRTLLLARGQAL